MAGLAAFLAVAVVVIVVPGQDTALTIRNTLAGGRRAGALTAFGVSTGLAVWTLAASAGLAALLIASEPLFLALRAAGAAYLLFLGAQALLAAIRRRPPAREASRGTALAPRVAFRQGAVSNLGNPKIAVFFTSLLPQFGGVVRGVAGPRPAVLRDDARVAPGLRGRRRARRRRAAPPGGASCDRRHRRRRARRLRAAPRD